MSCCASFPDGWVDIKACMPSYTQCPVCSEVAWNIYSTGINGNEDTEMEAFSDHEFAFKCHNWSIVYTHKKCLVNANS